MELLRTSRGLLLQLVAVLVVTALGLVAAVTVTEPRRVPVERLLQVSSAGQAATATGSFRIDLSASFDGPGDAVEVAGTTDLDAATGDSTGRLQLPGGGGLAFRTTAGRGYLELPETSPLRLGSTRWVGFPLEQPLSADPLAFMALFGDDPEVLELGREDVRGVPSTHYRARLDAAALARLGAEQSGGTVLPPEALELVEGGRADLWLSDDGLPRRVRLQLEAGGLDVELGFELYEFGAPVQVAAPPAAEVLDVASQQEALRFLSGR